MYRFSAAVTIFFLNECASDACPCIKCFIVRSMDIRGKMALFTLCDARTALKMHFILGAIKIAKWIHNPLILVDAVSGQSITYLQ